MDLSPPFLRQTQAHFLFAFTTNTRMQAILFFP